MLPTSAETPLCSGLGGLSSFVVERPLTLFNGEREEGEGAIMIDLAG